MIKRFIKPPEHDRWDDYFEPGETLLWQGSPAPGPRSYWPIILLSIFGLPFLLGGLATAGMGLSALWNMNGLGALGGGLFMLAFSVPFLGAGAAMSIGSWLYAFNEHKFVRYALTNKRAYLANSLFKHSLKSYKINADDAITLDQGRFDSVKFKSYQVRDSDGDKTTETIGFDGLTNGHEVYQLIRRIQRESEA